MFIELCIYVRKFILAKDNYLFNLILYLHLCIRSIIYFFLACTENNIYNKSEQCDTNYLYHTLKN